MGIPNRAGAGVSREGSRLLLSVALPFLDPQRPPLGPQLAEGAGEKRIVCGRVSQAGCSSHAPLAGTWSCVPSNWREPGQWRPVLTPEACCVMVS